MRKIIFPFIASALSCSVLSAFWPEATNSNLEIGVGYTQGQFEYVTHVDPNNYVKANNGARVPESYDLITTRKSCWTDLNIQTIGARTNCATCDDFYFRANGNYGWITSGKHRTDVFQRKPQNPNEEREEERRVGTIAAHTRGHIYDVSIAAGYQFQYCQDVAAFSPIFGYSWRGQRLRNSHFEFSNSSFSESLEVGGSSSSSRSFDLASLHIDSNIVEIDNSYDTRWNGPFVGFDALYNLDCDWTLTAGYEYHWGKFHARTEEFVGGAKLALNQHGKSYYGHVVNLGMVWNFTDYWTLGLQYEFDFFHVHHGRQTFRAVKGSQGDIEVVGLVSVPLKRVEWCTNSIRLTLGLVY